jgi:hypothetical protein
MDFGLQDRTMMKGHPKNRERTYQIDEACIRTHHRMPLESGT